MEPRPTRIYHATTIPPRGLRARAGLPGALHAGAQQTMLWSTRVNMTRSVKPPRAAGWSCPDDAGIDEERTRRRLSSTGGGPGPAGRAHAPTERRPGAGFIYLDYKRQLTFARWWQTTQSSASGWSHVCTHVRWTVVTTALRVSTFVQSAFQSRRMPLSCFKAEA